MKTFVGLAMIPAYVAAGVFLSIKIGITHGLMGYFVGALVGFGGSVVCGAIVLRMIAGKGRRRR